MGRGGETLEKSLQIPKFSVSISGMGELAPTPELLGGRVKPCGCPA